MRIEIWSIGKTHETYVKPGIEEFTKRLNHYFNTKWVLIPTSKHTGMCSEMDLKKKEGELVLDWLEPADFLVLLDEKGEELTSIGLATLLQKKADTSTKKMVFLIGGAFGVSQAVQQRAQFTWCLSKLVFPHQLVRLILAEQLYRAGTILKNEKYHHQ
ncbi:MAG: 23S rRNA (pseudouridine(1915)-N(3))-methyltransferase RlmH [Bacteroidetes bacterium]|nr:23S rRNA (pseudouridine(1915)-N(3))-methyltransferase RlmH [Bacteroidota bacterium]